MSRQILVETSRKLFLKYYDILIFFRVNVGVFGKGNFHQGIVLLLAEDDANILGWRRRREDGDGGFPRRRLGFSSHRKLPRHCLGN